MLLNGKARGIGDEAGIGFQAAIADDVGDAFTDDFGVVCEDVDVEFFARVGRSVGVGVSEGVAATFRGAWASAMLTRADGGVGVRAARDGDGEITGAMAFWSRFITSSTTSENNSTMAIARAFLSMITPTINSYITIYL